MVEVVAERETVVEFMAWVIAEPETLHELMVRAVTEPETITELMVVAAQRQEMRDPLAAAQKSSAHTRNVNSKTPI